MRAAEKAAAAAMPKKQAISGHCSKCGKSFKRLDLHAKSKSCK